MPDRMTDKVTIITGAGTGIGRACMKLFSMEGAKVIGCGRRENMLQESLDVVAKSGGEGHIFSADLSDLKDAEKVISETMSLYGRIDCLVHAASVGWSWSHTSQDSMNDIANTPPEKWHEVIGINLNACYYMCHGVLQHMLKAGQGSIVNVASISGMVGMQ
ncbi:MAG TPA: SDR family oxidoreductase, partial [Dehalococcoidia bacterium]|nr:SDR family oxidoreductase [Dehalococcoidia bacterium]